MVLMAGPCVIESEENLFKIARSLEDYRDDKRFDFYFKASFDKANRTSLESYRGPGLEEGLRLLQKVKDDFGYQIVTDVHESYQIKPVAEVADILQIPAFLCRQTDLLVAAAKTDRIVNINYGLMESLYRGSETTWMMSVLTLRMLAKMVTLEVSSKNISGPITIAQYAGKSAQVGLTSFLLFLAIVSVSLGVLNLLPIPILDGGHLLYYSIEAVTRKPVSEKVMIWGQQLGILLLFLLMSLAVYNDLGRLLN